MSIQTIVMSNFRETLITLGLDAREMLSKMWFCFKIVLMSLEESFSWEFAWRKNGIPMIFRYDLDLGRRGSSTWRELMLFELLT